MKRGQSAMEYLMTYGWAILVVLIVLAALFYLGVFNPKTTMSCNVQAPFVCKDIQVDEGGVTMLLGNLNVDSISDVNMKINGQDCLEIWIDGSVTNSASGIKNQITTLECVGLDLEEDEKVEVKVNFVYTTLTGLGHNVTATGTGEAEGGNIHVTEGLFAWYHMEGDATDSGPYGYDGVLEEGTDCSVVGKVGQGCYFDGDDDWISIAGTPSTINFSFGVWINVADFNTYRNIIGGGGIAIYPVAAYSRFRNYLGSNVGWVYPSLTMNPDTWYYVSFMFNGQTKDFWMCIDGDCQYKGDEAIIWTNGNFRSIGRMYSSPQRYFYGVIDELKVWDRVLTPEEVQNIYNSYN